MNTMNNNEATVEQINEVIADFMGYYFNAGKFYAKSGGSGTWFKEAKYHTSWDWLMPVVEKIEKIKGVHCVISEFGCDIYSFGKHISNVGGRETKIANVYEAVFVFIQWYNQQTKSEQLKH